MLLIITSTHGELFSCINIDNLERLRTPKIRGFNEFFTILGATHILSVLR